MRRLLAATAALALAVSTAVPALAADSIAPINEQELASAQPRFSGYRLQEIRGWSPETDPYAEFMRAEIPLQERNAPLAATQADPSLDGRAEVMLMQGDYGNAFFDTPMVNNDFSNNTLNFWQYVDYFSPWHGAATASTPSSLYDPATSDWRNRGFEFGIVNIPNPAYTNAAHRNGVKSIATIYFDPAFRPGLTFKESFERNPESDGYIIAEQLMAMADYYGYDGYFLNQEEGGDDSEFKPFMAHLTEQGYYTQWYDTNSTFNASKMEWLKDSTNGQIHDSVFVNYGWPYYVDSALAFAEVNGVDPYTETFFGVEANQGKFNGGHGSARDLPRLYEPGTNNPRAAVALFTPSDYYQRGLDDDVKIPALTTELPLMQQPEFQWMIAERERMYFSGVLTDPQRTGKQAGYARADVGLTDASGWVGVADFTPERSVINGTQFSSTFNTGRGMQYFDAGEVSNPGEWTDINTQSLLPSWQWWIDTTGTRPGVDFDYGPAEERLDTAGNPVELPYTQVGAWRGGSSLVVHGELTADATLRLFKTDLAVGADSDLAVTFKKTSADDAQLKAALIFADAPETVVTVDVPGSAAAGEWRTEHLDLSAYAGRKLATIGLQFGAAADYQINIGEIAVTDGAAAPAAPTDVQLRDVYADGQAVVKWTKAAFDVVDGYAVEAVYGDRTEWVAGGYTDIAYVKNLDTDGLVRIDVRAIGKDGQLSEAASTSFDFGAQVADIKVAEAKTASGLLTHARDAGELAVTWDPAGAAGGNCTIDVRLAFVAADNPDNKDYSMTVPCSDGAATVPLPVEEGYAYDLTITPEGRDLGVSYRGRSHDSHAAPMLERDLRLSGGQLVIGSPTTLDWWKLNAKFTPTDGAEQALVNVTRGDISNRGLQNPRTLSGTDGMLTITLTDYSGNVTVQEIAVVDGALQFTPVDPQPGLDGVGLPAVVPEVREFTPGDGADFFVTGSTRIIVGDESLTDEANLLADELVAVDLAHNLGLGVRPEVVTGVTPAPGDIVLNVGAVDTVTSGQGYSLVVDGHVTITGPTDQGTFYGTRTLLQSLVLAGGAEAGTVLDEPTVELRSLHVDAARKYFSPEWFKDQFRQMAWVKLNQLQYHFSENEGFRLESTSHPEIVSSQYITKDELAKLIAYAARYHIEIVPALDVPGHMAQALRAHPEWRASTTSEGSKILDYSKPEVRQFVFDLIDEYAPLFPSSAWHLGGDEVFALDQGSVEARFPNLHQYAKDNVGAGATIMDGYVHYINTVAEYLNEKGKEDVRAWNDAVYTPGSSVALNSNVDIAYWTKWHRSMPTVQTILDNGHDLINFNDAYFYYVLTYPGWAYSTKPTADKIYNEWTPGRFPSISSTQQQIIANDHDQLLGASFAIWADKPEVETEQQVASGIKYLLRAMASRSWNAGSTATYAEWNQRATAIGDAPEPTIPVAPELTASLTVDPSGEVAPGTEQTWTLDVPNAGASEAQAEVSVDLAELAAVADLGTATAVLLDGEGKPVGEPGSNVARGAAVRASGQEVAGQWGPDQAIDGDRTTRFSSNESDNAWIDLRLAEPTVVDHVTIHWELAAARYKLQTSADGVTWTDATDELRGAVGGTSRVELNPTGPVQWIRMQALQRSAAENGGLYGVSLYEFEVWTGAESGVDLPAAEFDGTTLTWAGPIPAGHTLRLEWGSTIKADAVAGTKFTVTATVDAPFFPGVATDEVTGTVASEDPGTPEPTVDPTVDPTDEPTVDPTDEPTVDPTVDPTDEPTVDPTVDPTDEPTDAPTTTPPTKQPTAPAKPKYERTAPYTQPGLHKLLNGRDWYTICEPYSQTERCRTDIWATVVVKEDGRFVRKDGWTFNNLTYLPYMTRAAWGANPLANTGAWTAETDGRQWRTECDTARTGRDGCRSYAKVTVYLASARPEGGYIFSQRDEWVFNNIVMFGGPELR